ncbi:MAG TPA: DUF1926 domain-containing protein [candidate division WOR-3 bacterium]|uniref:DUF1926 domain-containing protein n=1 Tax=candidate division WOR-3 bacterium TaxID=2052148 RepID=A0A9C9ENS1_UNCW3|nr:DUF1926 domain-containing protein [candidate division WOR-3 bacterium]
MIRFAFYIHNHQPTGNFDEVFENAYKWAYLPLLKSLLKHKNIKFGIHNSGILLEWIEKKHPEFFEMLKESVRNGQSELLSSAYGEPVLSLIPRKDIIEQIKYFNDYLYKHFNYRPKGLWLTERIWEPDLIHPLLDAGIEYILLDDTHFFYAGLKDDDLYSYYITEDEGRILKVFPISMKLRYLIPFHPITETIKFLKEEEKKKNNCLRTLADDGEKFGVWPGTHNWVYKKKWLDNFLDTLEKERWIKPVLLSEIAEERPAGRVYLPTSSYEEMGEWVLPPECGRNYETLKKSVGRKYYYLIHGGYFKNFLRKYPEANIMHKRMLFVSKNISPDIKAKLFLWKGQCSCAYWHGLFGGLYLPHLREAIYKNLIQAEEYDIPQIFQEVDFDVDGEKEILVSNNQFFIVLKPSTASFIELDDRKRKMNLLNYLNRTEEKYHKKQGTEDFIYDRYPRSFGLDRLLKAVPTAEDFRCGKNLGEILNYRKYTVLDKKKPAINFSGEIEKTITFSGAEQRTIEIKYSGVVEKLGVEFSLGVFSTNLRLQNNLSLMKPQTLNKIKTFTILADNFHPLKFKTTRPCTLLSYPIETVSSSEKGLEKLFQGIGLLLIFDDLPTIHITI